MKIPNDRRIWLPDETCFPFYLDNATDNTNNILFRFKTPHDALSIITSVSGGTNLGVTTKNDARVVIIRGFHAPGSSALVNETPVKLSGSLVAEELRGPTEAIPNVPRESGFYIAPFPEGSRHCRIILPEGEYTFVERGSGAAPVYFSTSGYTFSLTRKDA